MSTSLAQAQALPDLQGGNGLTTTTSEESNLTLSEADPYSCIKRGDCYLEEWTNMAATVIPITSISRIRLLGQGLMSRKTHQYVGVACVGAGDSCEVMRFVYQVNSSEAYFIGPKFRVNPNYEGDNKKIIKKAMREYYGKATNSGQRGLLTYAGLTFGSAALGMGAVALGAPGIVLAPAAVLFAIGLGKGAGGGERYMGISSFPAFDISSRLRDAAGKSVGVYLTNQNGWNWAEHPKTIKEKHFASLIYNLQSINGFFSRETKVFENGDLIKQ